MSTRALIKSKVDTIVIHCSDSPRGRGDTAETINQWHLQNGWDLIGYHAVIGDDGQLEDGRPLYVQGAHCRGHNDHTIGICIIGDDYPTYNQRDTLDFAIDYYNRYFGKDLEVVGHCDLDSKKTCPNFDVKDRF